MKEIKIIIGIVLLVAGAVFFEMNRNALVTIVGLVLLCTGVVLYILTVDSLDKHRKKNDDKEDYPWMNPS